MAGERFCANPSCSKVFTPRRPHGRYCSDECRYVGWAAQTEEASENGSQRVERQPRRPSRNGRGAKVYLLHDELLALEEGPMAIRNPEQLRTWQTAQIKLSRAKRRLAGKGAGSCAA